MNDQLKPLLGKLALFSQNRLGFKNPPRLFLRNDSENSQHMLGKTAFYNPEEQSITLFVHSRHPKDILRSFAHELVHHAQNLRGDLAPEKMTATGPGYAQECPHMRKMEKEAYLKGNMCFRDWEDKYKLTQQESKFLKENKQMTTKITKQFLKETIKKVLQENEAVYMLKKYSYSKGGANAGKKLSVGDPTMDRYDSAGNPMPEDAKEYHKDGIEAFQKSANFPSSPGVMMPKKGPSYMDQAKAGIDKIIKGLGVKQQKLNKRLGFSNMQQLQKMVGAPTTGVYDSDTNVKVKAFQKALGFGKGGQDGLFGPATMRKLKASQKSPKELADEAVDFVADFVDQFKTPAQHVKDMDKAIKAAGVNTRVPDTQAGSTQVGTTMREEQELEEGDIPQGLKDYMEKKKKKDKKEPAGMTDPDAPMSVPADDEDPPAKEGEKPDIGDIDGDGNKDESAKGAAKDKEAKEKEEKPKEKQEESKIQTPEQENALYEQRFAPKNNRLFEKLVKQWTK